MTKLELVERLGALAERHFFDRGDLQRGLDTYRVMGIDPPPRLFISCGCALWREGKYLEAAGSFAMAPLELVRDHLKACRVECLARRQVCHAVEIARMEQVCIKDELASCALQWRKQGHIREAVAAYQAAGVAIPANEFRGTGLAFLYQGLLDVALDAFEAARIDPPRKDLCDWLSSRSYPGANPGLERRVLEALLRASHE